MARPVTSTSQNIQNSPWKIIHRLQFSLLGLTLLRCVTVVRDPIVCRDIARAAAASSHGRRPSPSVWDNSRLLPPCCYGTPSRHDASMMCGRNGFSRRGGGAPRRWLTGRTREQEIRSREKQGSSNKGWFAPKPNRFELCSQGMLRSLHVCQTVTHTNG